MGFIQEIFRKRREKLERFKQMQEEDSLYGTLDERKKSHNEREFLKILEKEREKRIKEFLYWEEKRRQNEEKLRARQMMSFNHGLFNNDSILKEDRKFLLGGSGF